MKLGDLGASVKLSEKDVDGDKPLYYVKGYTPGFVTETFEDAFTNET